MLSNKPYLIRAFFEWMVDSACTPLVLIDALYPNCKVPQQFIDENNQITLNISPNAVRDLKLGNEFLEFQASFGGVVHFISCPTKAILGIYTQENGEGMAFDFEEEYSSSGGWEALDDGSKPSSPSNTNSTEKKSRPSHLKLVE